MKMILFILLILEYGKLEEIVINGFKNNESRIYKINAPNDEGFTASLVEIIFYLNTNDELTLTTGMRVIPEIYIYPSLKSSSN